MIERLSGRVVITSDRTLTVLTSGIGFGLQVPDSARFKEGHETVVYTHVHWNSEKGQSLFGFDADFSRQVFLLLISCSKIGPALALALLRQKEPQAIVQDIMSGNTTGLSSCQGIGAKKAETIIHELKDKVVGLVGLQAMSGAGSFVHLHHMQEALLGLSYSAQEVQKAAKHVSHLYQGQQSPDVTILLRAALAFLATSSE